MKKLYLMEYQDGDRGIGAHIFYDFGNGIRSLIFKNLDDETVNYGYKLNELINEEERKIPKSYTRFGKSYFVADLEQLRFGNVVIKTNHVFGTESLESGLLVGIPSQTDINYSVSVGLLRFAAESLGIDTEIIPSDFFSGVHENTGRKVR